jgi:hypothetical protein
MENILRKIWLDSKKQYCLLFGHKWDAFYSKIERGKVIEYCSRCGFVEDKEMKK